MKMFLKMIKTPASIGIIFVVLWLGAPAGASGDDQDYSTISTTSDVNPKGNTTPGQVTTRSLAATSSAAPEISEKSASVAPSTFSHSKTDVDIIDEKNSFKAIMKRGIDGAFRFAQVALSVFGIFWLFGPGSVKQVRWCNLFNNCETDVSNDNAGGNLQDPNLISQYQQQQQQPQQLPDFNNNNNMLVPQETYENSDGMNFNNNVPYGMKRRRSVSFSQFISPIVQQLMTSYGKLATQNVDKKENDATDNFTQ